MRKAKKGCSAIPIRQRDLSAPLSSVLDLWEQWADRYERCADAAATLIVAEPQRVTTFADLSILEACLRTALEEDLAAPETSRPCFWLSAITQFLDWSGRISQAVELYRDTFDYLKKNHEPAYPESRAVAMELHGLLRRLGRNQEAAAVNRELRVEPSPAQSDTARLTNLRDAALNAFSDGCFAEAEATYRYLLQRNFEMAGTHCHLARVLLALGRDADAMAEVNSAWLCRHTGEPYIVARILFLKALLATLAGHDAQSHLIMLQEILERAPGRTVNG